MPTVNVDAAQFFKALGREYSVDEFRELCFDYGIELDDVREIPAVNGKPATTELAIDIPANRYDLLCAEGIARALNIFQGRIRAPKYKTSTPAKQIRIVVGKETARIRPYVVGAVLRDVTFTEENYDNFIDLQEKLHANLCRRRTLVAIGTHDLDTMSDGPVLYDALKPKDIKFVPLNEEESMDGELLMKFYEKHRTLSKYLHIIRDSPVFPLVMDAKRTVLSLPPIINGDHSKIKLSTRNIFIEATATDLTKAKVTLNTLVCMFSEYCSSQFTVEPVEVVMPDGSSACYPDLTPRMMTVKTDYINSLIGVTLSGDQTVDHLNRMSLSAHLGQSGPGANGEVIVEVPPTRSDIIHACDVAEDVAISCGFNNITKTVPNVNTIAAALPINKLSDLVRRELALAGWTEVLPFILCSHDDNFANLRREDPGTEAVVLANPQTAEFQVVRTSLLPGLLKTLCHSKNVPLPLKLFEVSDVALKDEAAERRARNERRVAVVYSSKVAGFEIIHGLLHRLMQMLHTNLASATGSDEGYYIRESENPTYFPGRSADVFRRTSESSEGTLIGTFGTVHPEVLEKFDAAFPVAALEFNLEPFL